VIGLRGHPAALRVHPQQILRLVNVGLPCAVEQTTLRISQLILAAVVTQLGTATYAGHQLGIQILSVAFMPGLAFSIAATTLVGQELGRKNPQRAEACVYTTLWMASFVMGLVGLILFLFAEPLLGVFTSEPDVIAQGVQAVRGCAIIDIPLGWYFVLSGGLRGAGDTRFVLLAQSAPIWLVRMPLAYRLGLSLGWGLPGVWFGMILDMSARGMLLMLRLRSGAWKRIQV
jgi:putative MATE family efflux protein